MTHPDLRRTAALAAACTVALASVTLTATATDSPDPSTDRAAVRWTPVNTGRAQQFRGLAAVNGKVAWLAGEKGMVLRTTNAGRTWLNRSPRAARGMMLRDIEAQGPSRAVALAIGPGEDSRIYRTVDGGKSWHEKWRGDDERAFYDCLAFNKFGTGVVMGDPVDGRFQILRSRDHGRTWRHLPTTGMPRAMKGEFGFAASGTCLVTDGGSRFWFATGGIKHPRVFRSDDGGLSWTAHRTSVVGGPSAGIYSLAAANKRRLVAVGGDYGHPGRHRRTSAVSTSSGRRWVLSQRVVRGYRSGVSYVPGARGYVLAVGPSGSDVSRDQGRTWFHFGDTAYDGVQCVRRVCWASGPDGKVGRTVVR